MADDQGEKTEQPTQKRRQDSREKGQVAKSPDLSGSALLLLGCVVLMLFGGWMVERVSGTFIYLLSHMDTLDLSPETVNAHATAGGIDLAVTMAPLLISLLVGALAVSAAQVGFHLSGRPFEPDFSRLDPIQGFGRIFSLRSFIKLAGGLAKMLVVAAVVYMILKADVPAMAGLIKNLSTTGNTTAPVAAFIAEEALLVAVFASFTLLVLALLDYGYQRWQHTEDLKMTKQEVKDEMRNMEGDPQIKKRRLEAQRKVAQGRMMQEARTADVMVTNPTHYTVAIRYQPDDPAPLVVAKGAELLALKLREIAKECKIPIVERKELARGLYRWVEVGERVPEKFWKAVAEVLAFIWRKDDQRKQQFLEGLSSGGLPTDKLSGAGRN